MSILRASEAAHLTLRPHSPDTFRQRDFLGRYPSRHAFPAVIANEDDSKLEQLLAMYGNYFLNQAAGVSNTTLRYSHQKMVARLSKKSPDFKPLDDDTGLDQLESVVLDI